MPFVTTLSGRPCVGSASRSRTSHGFSLRLPESLERLVLLVSGSLRFSSFAVFLKAARSLRYGSFVSLIR